MSKNSRTIPAAKFKAECLAILDDVAETGDEVIVTKRGKPVAKVIPADRSEPVSLLGSVTFHGNVISPILDEWDVDR